MSLSWNSLLGDEKKSPYFQQILDFVQHEREMGKAIYPANKDIFNAFKLTSPSDLCVVILGQDPYHGANQAHGLCFSVNTGVPIPPSLNNIYKELATDIPNFSIPNHGNLTQWAEQGVLLLNTVLTVEAGQAHSHSKIGWEQFTDSVIMQINKQCSDVVFLLWGSHAQKKAAIVDTSKHYVLTSVHPSPLSAYRGFLGCQHFSKTNEFLISKGKQAIRWQLD